MPFPAAPLPAAPLPAEPPPAEPPPAEPPPVEPPPVELPPAGTPATYSPPDEGDVLDPQRSDDDLIVYTLIQTWALITGRGLRDDVPPAGLSDDELIAFWGDPLMEPEEIRA